MTLALTGVIDHCTIIITDVQQARAFYGELLGLREIAPPKTFDFIVLWYALGDSYLHLLLKEHPDTASPRHFCLRVQDIAAARQWMSHNAIPIEETVPIPGCDRFFIFDPFGNRIEILQWLQPYRPEVDGLMQT